MGRKKAEGSIESIVEEDDGLSSEISNAYGDFMTTGLDLLAEEDIIVSVSPAMDLGLSGGVPAGSWTIISGPAKAGKTTIALHIAAQAQKNEKLKALTKNGKVKVFYHDLESRLKRMHLDACKDLDKENFIIIRSKKGDILTGEQQLDAIEKCIKSEPGSVVIVDSFSILSTENELVEGLEKQQRAESNKLVAKFVRRMAQAVPINKCILIGMVWLISNPSGYGSPTQEKISSALAYQADIKLRVKKVEDWIVSNKKVGQIINWKIVTSALGGNGAEVNGYLRYGDGIDEISELMAIGTELGLISQKGPWVSFDFLQDGTNDETADKKYCGSEKAADALKENLFYQKYLRNKIMEMVA